MKKQRNKLAGIAALVGGLFLTLVGQPAMAIYEGGYATYECRYSAHGNRFLTLEYPHPINCPPQSDPHGGTGKNDSYGDCTVTVHTAVVMD